MKKNTFLTYCQEYENEDEEEGQAEWDLDMDEDADFVWSIIKSLLLWLFLSFLFKVIELW